MLQKILLAIGDSPESARVLESGITLSEIFLGSTSNYVLHYAPCSVMVVRSPVSFGEVVPTS
jgi:hypothetical protein